MSAAAPQAKPAAEKQEAPKPTTPEPPQPPVEEAAKEGALAVSEEERSEFDSIFPELRAGEPFLIGKEDIMLPSKKEPGVLVKVRPVKTRQLLAIGRILTGATRPINIHLMLEPIFTATDRETQMAGIVAAATQLLIAVPHSEREFIQLLYDIIQPLDTKSTDEEQLVINYMGNPDPVDTIQILSVMYIQELPNWRRLGKALTIMLPQPQAQPESQ